MSAASTPTSALAPLPSGDGVDALPWERVNAPSRFFRGSLTDLREVLVHRELLGNLVRKEIKIKYKDSLLGLFWTLLRPLLQLLVYSIAIGVFLGSGKAIPQFGVYLFTGLLCWTMFSDTLGGCTGSIISNAGLVKKVYFPRELFPLAVVGAALVNFVFQSAVLLLAYVVTGDWPVVENLALVPLALLVLVLFGGALGLLLAAANVYLRDVQYLVEVGLLLWFWMTPIVYDWRKVETALTVTHHWPWLFQIYMANPLANVVLAFQRALWPGGQTTQGSAFIYPGNLYGRLGILCLVSLLLLWLAQRVFARAQGNFAQEL